MDEGPSGRTLDAHGQTTKSWQQGGLDLPAVQTYALDSFAHFIDVWMGSSRFMPVSQDGLSSRNLPSLISAERLAAHCKPASYGLRWMPPSHFSAMLESLQRATVSLHSRPLPKAEARQGPMAVSTHQTWCKFSSAFSHLTWMPFPPCATAREPKLATVGVEGTDELLSRPTVLRVQRLVNIANEVDDKLGRLVPPPGVQAVVQELLRVVLDGADHTAVLFTVTVEIHATVRGRGVFGIYEVEVLGEASPATT